MTAAGGEQRIEDPAGAFPELGRMLRELAYLGAGVVLGLAGEGQRRRAGITRVSRAERTRFGDLLVELYQLQYASLVRYSMREFGDRARAEDVVQRAFEKVWKRQPDPDELTNPNAYLVTAVRNEINRELRRVIQDRQRLTGDAMNEPTTAELRSTGTDVSTQVVDRMALREALATLSEREREAVVLRVQWQLSTAETAEIMGVSNGAVKGYTHHGLRKLKERVGTTR